MNKEKQSPQDQDHNKGVKHYSHKLYHPQTNPMHDTQRFLTGAVA